MTFGPRATAARCRRRSTPGARSSRSPGAGTIDSASGAAGRPKEDAIRRRECLRRVYAVWLRECVEGWESDTGWRGAEGNWHWMTFRAGYLAGQAGVGEDVALEDHEAWTERVMALPDGERPRILDTEEGPPPERPDE